MGYGAKGPSEILRPFANSNKTSIQTVAVDGVTFMPKVLLIQ